jgi:hypothetical protein
VALWGRLAARLARCPRLAARLARCPRLACAGRPAGDARLGRRATRARAGCLARRATARVAGGLTGGGGRGSLAPQLVGRCRHPGAGALKSSGMRMVDLVAWWGRLLAARLAR